MPEPEQLITGFACPAQGYEDRPFADTLGRYLMPHPVSCFPAWVQGDCYGGLGLAKGDLVIIDKGFGPDCGRPLVFCRDNAFAFGRFEDLRKGDVFFGAVTFIIRAATFRGVP